jgi:hypothetical protein
MPSPRQLSRDLRERSDSDLRRRRWSLGLSLFGVAMGQIVALFQMGIIKRLPDPPGPFDSTRVDASDYGYKRLQMPDSLLMIGNYAVTAMLAGAGGKDRAIRQPHLPIALAAKAGMDVATNLKLAQEEWAENKALCAYCQAATLASLATLVIALPEAVRAFRRL